MLFRSDPVTERGRERERKRGKEREIERRREKRERRRASEERERARRREKHRLASLHEGSEGRECQNTQAEQPQKQPQNVGCLPACLPADPAPAPTPCPGGVRGQGSRKERTRALSTTLPSSGGLFSPPRSLGSEEEGRCTEGLEKTGMN